MPGNLIFYTNPLSRGRIVRWLLEEIGEPYETVLIDFGPSADRSAFRAINPMLKVPAIAHDGHVVTETAAICAYLADAFPASSLGPRPEERADYYRWLFFAAGPAEAAMVNHRLKVDVPPRWEGMVGYGSHDRVVGALELAVSTYPYVTGPRFTAADIYVGSQIGWGLSTGTLPSRPAFSTYLDRVMYRPAALRSRAIDDALLPKDQIPKIG